jgi:hypothetical protein
MRFAMVSYINMATFKHRIEGYFCCLLLMSLRVVWDMLKQVASNVTEVKNLVSVSLPVRIFEPRSYLEVRLCRPFNI